MTTMRMVVLDPPAELEAWLERRRASGQDRFDEVWQGEYHVAPAPHSWHGAIEYELVAVLRPHARRAGLHGLTAFNLGTPEDYRIPDHGYVRALSDDTFVASADIIVEILSPGDETYAKQDFYLAHGVTEMLVVDPRQRTAQWYVRTADGFQPRTASELLGVAAAELTAAVEWPAVA